MITRILFFAVVATGATILVCLCIKKIVEAFINIAVLLDERKHPGRYLRKGGGVVLNKKTKKLEEEKGSVILPF